MATKQDLKGNPNYAIPPGQTLLDTLEEIGMTQAELSRRMGRPLKTINEIKRAKLRLHRQLLLN
jgi:plasmid maintenance system antidote protein VapI